MTDDDGLSRTADSGLRRRRLLQSVGAAGALVLSGCLGGGDDTDETPAGESTPAATATPGASTPNSTPTATAETQTTTDTKATDSTTTDTPADAARVADRPVTGEEVPALSVFDDTMLEYMAELDIDAGALGVAKDGEVVLERGYGWGDPEQTEPLSPDALFRIASISKGITDAAVVKLANEGELSGDDLVYPLLDVEPPGGELADERFREVTVRHLLRHTGGWDIQQLGYDPMYSPVRVADHLGLDEPPTKYDITRFMLDQPMQFDPGTREVYSNFGYSLLGQVIESVTGRSYEEYVAAELFEPAGVEGIEIGYTRPADRPPEEVWYDDHETCSNAFTLDESQSYTCADAGFLVSEFDAAGGYIASTTAMLSYLRSYWLSGEARDDQNLEYLLFGSHPGSFALARQYPDDVDVVALFNRRELPLSQFQRIDSRLQDAVAAVDQWP